MRLVIEDEAGTRTIVPFTSEELTLGRAQGVAWRLPPRNVSRRHARFTRAGGSVFVEDLGSLTGTWLNGERLTGRRRVRPGDLVEIGDYDLVVAQEGTDAAGPHTPPPLQKAILRAELEIAAPAPLATASPVIAEARSRRWRRALVVGVAALAGGLLVGLLLGRLVR